MAHSGKDLGADLYSLEQVAKSDLPTVSSAYGDAIGKINGANTVVTGMSPMPDTLSGGHGSVAESYGGLHEAVGKALSETQSSLDDTAKALHDAARLYADNDRAASDEFHRLMESRGEPKPE
jgi:uncharacterized protein YukE